MIPVTTFSLVACDLDAGQWGIGVASKFLAVGSLVPWAAPGVGALATQAYANPGYGPDGLELLREGRSADEVVAHLVGADEDRDERQVGVVDALGRGASFTGSECMAWAGGRTGPGYAAQGNLLVAEATVDALADSFESSAGGPLAERLLDALDAAQQAGGDRRGQQSAAILMVEHRGGYAGLTDVVVDLRADDHSEPLTELRRLYGLHGRLFGKTARTEWLAVDEDLELELRARLAALGYRGSFEDALRAWAGAENLEERLDGVDALDPVLVDALRSAAPAGSS